MSEEDKQSKLTENDIKAINGLADFFNGISNAIETYIDDAFLYEYCKCGCHTVKRIYYCPMCGRKLGE